MYRQMVRIKTRPTRSRGHDPCIYKPKDQRRSVKAFIGVGENCLIVSSHRNIHNKSVFDKTYNGIGSFLSVPKKI